MEFSSKLIENAVNDLKKAFEENLLFDPLNNPNYFNIKTFSLSNTFNIILLNKIKK